MFHNANGRIVSPGGEAGQVLTASGGGAYGWGAAGAAVPSAAGANDGDTLTADGLGGYDWAAPPDGVPDASGAGDGHVLTADGGGGYAWEAPAAPSGVTRRATLGPAVTGSIAASNGTENVNIALPAGVTACEIVRLSITRTDGTGTSASIDAYTLDDRSDGTPRLLFGSSFGGITVDPGPEYGPAVDAGGSRFFSPVSYINVDGSEFIRLTVTNRDGANVATYSISIVINY